MNAKAFFRLAGGALVLASPGCQRHSALASSGTTQQQQALAATQQPTPFATPPVLPGTPDVATLVAKVTPSVVNVTVVQAVKRADMPFDLGPMFGQHGREDGDRVFRQRGLGTGFIIDPVGHVVTNAHVVEDAAQVRVKLADEREFDAKVKGKDDRLDIAVLELQGAKDLPSISLGSSDRLRVGEYVVAIGNPFGLGNTVTMGIVSAKSRAIGAGPYDDFIQTDASINPGNSGGPLFNLEGQVVGINTAISAQGRGIGFAIPIDAVREVLPQLLASGHVARGRLGVLIQAIDSPLAKALGLDHAKGALIGEVEQGGPAEKAGIRSGDVILAVDHTEIAHAQELPRLVARHQPGSRVTLTLRRDKSTRDTAVTLDALEEEATPAKPPLPAAGPQNLGMSMSDARGGGALVDRVTPGGPVDEELESGDVILEVNQKSVARAADAKRLLLAVGPGQVALVKLRREGKIHFVAIER